MLSRGRDGGIQCSFLESSTTALCERGWKVAHLGFPLHCQQDILIGHHVQACKAGDANGQSRQINSMVIVAGSCRQSEARLYPRHEAQKQGIIGMSVTGLGGAPRATCSGPHRRLSRPCVVTLAAGILMQTERNASLPQFPPEASHPAAPCRLRVFAVCQQQK